MGFPRRLESFLLYIVKGHLTKCTHVHTHSIDIQISIRISLTVLHLSIRAVEFNALIKKRVKELIAIKKSMPVKFLTHDKILYTSATLLRNRNLLKIGKVRLYSFSELLFTV